MEKFPILQKVKLGNDEKLGKLKKQMYKIPNSKFQIIVILDLNLNKCSKRRIRE